MSPMVSVVIPIYNAEATIKAVIDAVFSQDYPQEMLELILVDDGSLDKSADIIQQSLKLTLPLPARYLSQTHSGPAAARNAGWKAAAGEIICFTDADCLPTSNWVSSLIGGFTSCDIGAVCGSYDIANNQSLLARCIWREITYRHSLMPNFVRSFGAYNFSAKKAVLEKVGGFDASYTTASGEDNDLAYRILGAGFKIYFAKSALVKHYFPEQLAKYLQEQSQHGLWRMKLYIHHPRMMCGDDYTHFKDALEPVLVSAIVFFACLSWISEKIFFSVVCLLMFYIALQLLSSIQICRQAGSFEYLYLAYINFFRGFARTFGAWLGLWKKQKY